MKITFKGTPMTLEGTLVKVGDKIDFKATNKDFSPFDFSELKGKVVISTFPSINTGACDEQTRAISQLASKHKDITFLSLSLDLPPAQATWCAANGLENISIVSDYADRSFSKKYGLLISELKLMHRALIVVNAEGIVEAFLSNEEISSQPPFDELTKILN